MTYEVRTKGRIKQPVPANLKNAKIITPAEPLPANTEKKQIVMFTLMARGVTAKPTTFPVSVYVSPRLYGAQKLDAFPDWLHWTTQVKENGLSLEIQSGAKKTTIKINTNVLQPELWEEIFKDNALVRSYKFPNYTNRGILSYSVRQTLSALKATYQKASVQLALPDPETTLPDNQMEAPDSEWGTSQKRENNRKKLREMVYGLNLHWDGRMAQSSRNAVRIGKPPAEGIQYPYPQPPPLTGELDSEGAIIAEPNETALANIALPFAVFHHMPTPKYMYNRDDNEQLILDTENLLDFHQALTALNSYPQLLRALGLVFDLELPANFLVNTQTDSYETFWINKATPGWTWEVATTVPRLQTAYQFTKGPESIFCNAPRHYYDHSYPAMTLGLLNLDPNNFGLVQVDVDGTMHKTINLAETLYPADYKTKGQNVQPLEAPYPEIFDPEATLPSMRSGGFSLYADRRAQQLLDMLWTSKTFSDAVEGGSAQSRPFFGEDLVRGYRLDVWDSQTEAWHSLHMRQGTYQVGEKTFTPKDPTEEGFFQMAATQPAPGAQPVTNDLYLHEAMARWNGWSLSAPMPSKHLSRYPDSERAVPEDNNPDYEENQPDTPFKLVTKYTVAPKSLPRLKFGVKYRFRARAVDLAGNSLLIDDNLTKTLSKTSALPADPEGFAYLRFEPVEPPLIILRDARAIEDDPARIYDRGSAVDRLVIRTFNNDESKDQDAADTTASDRHIVPPRTSVEMAERLGMFDDQTGKIKADQATYDLISKRERGEFNSIPLTIKGHKPRPKPKEDVYPIEPGDKINTMPYLPDPLSRGAAIRNLPGTPEYTVGKAEPGTGAINPITYNALSDPNPRPGSATLISFGTTPDWQKTVGFLLAPSEPQANQKDLSPQWDPKKRKLTVYLEKGQTKVVPLTSYMTSQDLKLMAVWKWLREYIERISGDPIQQQLMPGTNIDQIAHILQRAVEGGHWMLTPPRIVTLVHAVQQPIGHPQFSALNVEHIAQTDENLKTASYRGLTDPTELAPIIAWRQLGETSAYLTGALLVHCASTAKIDLEAAWRDPVDDGQKWSYVYKSQAIEEIQLKNLKEHYIKASGKEPRYVGYYDPEHDQIAFVRKDDYIGYTQHRQVHLHAAMPRHVLNDTKHHLIKYKAVATSRYREYFSQDLTFTRESETVTVDVPASARPLAPDIEYIIPTFGWERQTDTNLKRSVRFGGGLRVYLNRPWFSSGDGELLGVALWADTNGALNQSSRDKFKPYFTQWGMDPIWQTGNLTGAPDYTDFPDKVTYDTDVTLEEPTAQIAPNTPGLIDVVGFQPQFDDDTGLWYADLTVNVPYQVYTPFIRLALVRYQPHAIPDAIVSRVVLADFAQLTADRSAIVTADPYHPKTLKVTVSGVAPTGPDMTIPNAPNKRPTQINVRIQRKDPSIEGDLGWTDAPHTVALIKRGSSQNSFVLWTGAVEFKAQPKPNQYRLVITEVEFISGGTTGVTEPKFEPPNRIVYTEIFNLDSALIG